MEYLLSGLAGLVFVVAALAWLCTCVVVVREKTVAVVEVFGQWSGNLNPGLRFKLPWPIADVVSRVGMKLNELKVTIHVKTRDNAFVEIPVSVQVRVSDPKKAYYELQDPHSQIKSYVEPIIRAKANLLDFQELYAARDEIKDEVETKISKDMANFGFRIENVMVNEPVPSAEVRDAFNKVIASLRMREAAHNEGEAKRVLLVAQAQAEKEAKKLQGEGIAEQRKAIAEGFKESVDLLKEATGLDEGLVVAVLTMTNQYDAIRDASANPGSTILMPYGGQDAISQVAQVAAAIRSLKERPQG